MHARVSGFMWGLGTKTQMLVLVWHEHHWAPHSPSITGLGAIVFGYLSIFGFLPPVFQCFSVLAPQTTWQWDQALLWSLVCALQDVYSIWPHPLDARNNAQWRMPPAECPLMLWWRAPSPTAHRSAQRWAQKLSSSQQHCVSWQTSAETVQGDLQSWCSSWVMRTLPVKEYRQKRKRPDS